MAYVLGCQIYPKRMLQLALEESPSSERSASEIQKIFCVIIEGSSRRDALEQILSKTPSIKPNYSSPKRVEKCHSRSGEVYLSSASHFFGLLSGLKK